MASSPTAPLEESSVLAIVLAMLVILLLAAAVVVYVAFPHRGADVPGVPWVGEAMTKAVDAVPTLDEEYADDRR
jgi:hypothetical protein